MKLAICEDEKIFQDVILEYLNPFLSKLSDISIEVFSCGADLLEMYKRGNRFDLVFLDVEMPGLNGVEVGQMLRGIDESVMLIFTTSYHQYVRQALSINAFQYLFKPIERDVFNEEFERALTCYRRMKYIFQIKHNDEAYYIEVKDIIYIETCNRHLRLVTQNNRIEYIGKIREEEKKLAGYDFVRCHQGYLLNMKCIFKPGNGGFILTTKELIPISRQLKNEVMSKYNKYMSRCCL